MAIQDQNRSRKVYSFFRSAPVPLPTTTGDAEMLIFANIGAMSSYNVSGIETGRLAFVNSVRDYFFIEKTINSGSTDSIQDVQASAFGGVWHRMGLGGCYWKNQRSWWINAEDGSDENLGSVDAPIKTLDELVRRLTSTTKIRSDYVVTLTSVTQSITNTFGLDVEFDGGSITFCGAPRFSASLGTITALSGDIDYSLSDVPGIYFNGTGSAGNNLLYSSGSSGKSVIGWALAGNAGTIFTTAFTGALGTGLFQASSPIINSPGIITRGRGSMIISGTRLGVSGSAHVVIGAADSAPISFVVSSVESNWVDFVGGSLVFDRSRIMSTSGSITIGNQTRMFGTGSGFTTPRQQINVNDSRLEHGSTVFWNSDVNVKSSQLILSTIGSSGSALASSSLNVQSDSVVDVRNMISTRSLEYPVKVTGQNCTVFYDTSQLPKADPVAVNNGHMQNFTWATLPWQDLMRDTKIVSGALNNTWSS